MMASIKKRGNKFIVIYDYDNDLSVRKQKWETFDSFAEANKRKVEIENEKMTGIFVPPSAQNVSEFLDLFVELYGTKKWSLSTYSKSISTINNYIKPYLGDMKVQSLTPLIIEKYYADLKKKPSVKNKVYKTKNNISTNTIKQIHKVLRCAFGMAVKWNIIGSNPFERVEPPKHVYAKREIWTSDMILKALNVCEDPKLAIAIHLSFACSLRLGEVLGMQWKNAHISDIDIENDNAYIDVVQELVTVSTDALTALDSKDVIFTFSEYVNKSNRKTKVILKKPKTESSIRRIWLPRTLAKILRKWKDEQLEYKNFFGDEYTDYDLIVCFEDGKQCTHSVIRKGLEKLTKEAELPKVVFHSLRHSSTTYKLKLNHGDIKATQGDTGHSQADMITDVYSHILDEDRKINAQKFDEKFYSNERHEQKETSKNLNIDAIVNELNKNPELLNQLLSALQE
ncbi:MAG: site-specific integrase [Thomasclavelia ramosa]|nr:site-specific integrase [Thomasclavelia ramosa]